MTDDEIKALKALANAASPGPWAHWVDDECPDDVRVCVNKDWSCHWCVALAGETVDGTVWTPETLARWRRDATFIAASRDAVPDLIAEVERLKVAVATARALDQRRHAEATAALVAERDQARKDAARAMRMGDRGWILEGGEQRARIEQYEADERAKGQR